ncbi:MAG: Maf-like protein [Micavibrio sp.]|nr:MAG: Maf-like protein [Micavibrio sp.]
MPESKANIILASRSMARRRMLNSAGLEFKCVAADLDEGAITEKLLEKKTPVEKIAATLAREKALHIAKGYPTSLIIGADQTLDFEHGVLSKADSLMDAREKLKILRGKTHRLVSAVCVVRGGEIMWEATDSAELTMIDFDDDYLESYIGAAGDALTHSVGAYEIENEGVKLFSDIKGDTDTILGLPLSKLLDYLTQELGVELNGEPDEH